MSAAAVPEQGPSLAARSVSGIVCWRVRTRAERAAHFAIRNRVFVEEQGVFCGSDRDSHDDDLATIGLIGYCDGVVAGTVRLFALDGGAGRWQGDRLAVLGPYRTRGVGAPLVRCAVATAGALGGKTMSAHIQLPNVTFFRRLGWEPVGEAGLYAGLPHQTMVIALPPPDVGTATVRALSGGAAGV
jgi:putative N-acetyltransferase (TIGR04045 family)